MTPCEAFTRKIIEKLFDGCGDLERQDAVDIGLEVGVLVTEPFDPVKHEHVDGTEGMVPGEDVVYVLAPRLRKKSRPRNPKETPCPKP